jgi:hypothetical protein
VGKWLASVFITLNLCRSLFAASNVTLADIKSWVALWQKREGLEQWKISVQIVRQSKLPPDVDGDVFWEGNPATAKIRVLCAADMERIYGWSPAEARRESELIVVHELMHLVLAPLDGGWNLSSTEEERLESVTEALAQMLLQRRVPGGVSEVQFINHQINGGPWKPAPEAKGQVILQLVGAMHTVSDDLRASLKR